MLQQTYDVIDLQNEHWDANKQKNDLSQINLSNNKQENSYHSTSSPISINQTNHTQQSRSGYSQQKQKENLELQSDNSNKKSTVRGKYEPDYPQRYLPDIESFDNLIQRVLQLENEHFNQQNLFLAREKQLLNQIQKYEISPLYMAQKIETIQKDTTIMKLEQEFKMVSNLKHDHSNEIICLKLDQLQASRQFESLDEDIQNLDQTFKEREYELIQQNQQLHEQIQEIQKQLFDDQTQGQIMQLRIEELLEIINNQDEKLQMMEVQLQEQIQIKLQYSESAVKEKQQSEKKFQSFRDKLDKVDKIDTQLKQMLDRIENENDQLHNSLKLEISKQQSKDQQIQEFQKQISSLDNTIQQQNDSLNQKLNQIFSLTVQIDQLNKNPLAQFKEQIVKILQAINENISEEISIVQLINKNQYFRKDKLLSISQKNKTLFDQLIFCIVQIFEENK